MSITGISSLYNTVKSIVSAAASGRPAKSADSVWDEIAGFIFTPVPSPLDCTSASAQRPTQQPGVHFYLNDAAEESWELAARQVSIEYCGEAAPSAEAITTTAQALRAANEKHLKGDIGWILSVNSTTPKGVDHRLFAWAASGTEIFIPTPTPITICPITMTPIPVPASTQAPVPQADASAKPETSAAPETSAKPEASSTKPTPTSPTGTGKQQPWTKASGTSKPPATAAPTVVIPIP
ncbi:MAG: hypothetical protein WC632_07215 [Candidatus Margulisiibacteriota bacterium]